MNATQIDFRAEARLYLGAILAIAQHLNPDGKLVGNEYQSLSPVRHDEHLGSFSINIKTGVWKDFADPSSKGGNDVFSYWKHCRQLSSMAAARIELMREISPRHRLETIAAIPDATYSVIMPAPRDAGPPPLSKTSRQNATDVHEYRDQDGQLLLVVGRYDVAGQRKTFRYLSYCQFANETSRWAWHAPPIRPLYGLERLAKAVEVVLVEGERKSDMAWLSLRDPSVAWLSLSGGAAAVGKMDYSPLAGRRVTLWPDRDIPGIDAMAKVAKHLSEMQCQVSIVDHGPIGNDGDGWDVYDAIVNDAMSPADIMSIVRRAKPIDGVATSKTPPRFGLNDIPRRDEFTYPICKDGKTCVDPANFAYLVEQFGIECRRNLMSQEAELTFPDGFVYPLLAEADTMAAIRENHLETIRLRVGFPEKNFARWIGMHADMHCYHPFIEWIGWKPNPGLATFERLVDALGGPTPRHERRFKLLRWMLSGIAVAYRKHRDPNGGPPKTHGILALVGPQGNGKSSFIASLAPPSMVMDGAHFVAGNKDSLIENTMRFIVEWAEAGNTLNKSTSEEIKAFCSRGTDFYRRPYDVKSVHVPRRTIFAATVNCAEFLKDEENRRWWVVDTDGSLDPFHRLDMRAVWREVLGLYLAGEPWWLDAHESDANRQANHAHREVSNVEELIRSSFDWQDHSNRAAMNAADVLRMLDLPQTKVNRNEAAAALRALADEGVTATKNHRGTTVWRVPIRTQAHEIDRSGFA